MAKKIVVRVVSCAFRKNTYPRRLSAMTISATIPSGLEAAARIISGKDLTVVSPMARGSSIGAPDEDAEPWHQF
jgi:hypothetical protein